MKAITIWQPWASLWVCGAKQFETRSWATSYRGPIAIHAGKILCHRFSCEVDGSVFAPAVNASLWPGETFVDSACELDTWEELPRGEIIATAELVGCHKIVRHGGRGMPWEGPGWLETDHGIYEPTDQELLFGDWTPGRYAWEITNINLLDTPIPAKGRQGLWNWDAAKAGEGKAE